RCSKGNVAEAIDTANISFFYVTLPSVSFNGWAADI
ncbi:MAG: hypothetical protein ACI8R8_002644, partial [Paraglaciecola sp.]